MLVDKYVARRISRRFQLMEQLHSSREGVSMDGRRCYVELEERETALQKPVGRNRQVEEGELMRQKPGLNQRSLTEEV